ncbi:hypothetical protein Z517_10522 [Fonsecaea pedrosoi CBS 271.37]|uniref:Protein-lysine N-methyltransferase EFM4 n=1 Tax=Fonsecaea pedrosoi CBS 271.37 TaxID=1442368 RepID=A0A0D2GTL1_9EURO|nr:uncharacterized protein Z517_10522 [Fonsecaea pedrosoi CBS 271.37]KIW75779.1 hypothetical protein Z517_10522 [Fonsecaea pedrosoi CBS 271.37]
MSAEKSHPAHLEPSELGTKEYWDEYYRNDLENGARSEDDEEEDGDGSDSDDGAEQPPDPVELESWFDDVDAPAKTLAFLTSTTFPLSPNYTGSLVDQDSSDRGSGSIRDGPSVLDLGTGNGSALFALRLHGHYTGRMVGVDYSSQSVELARKLRAQYASTTMTTIPSDMADLDFHVFDIIHDSATTQPWWPARDAGFDLVLDKGTFDAISLSSATVSDPDPDPNARQRRICELYPSRVLALVRPGGYLLVTSCNWTEAEVVAWFTGSSSGGRAGNTDSTAADTESSERAVFEVYDTIKYPVFEFGGQKGQGVASVCFRKRQKSKTD